jgi:hypothetical protein
LVATSLKADPVPFFRPHRFDGDALLYLPGVERRIDVDQIHRFVRKRPEHLQVIREIDLADGVVG